MKTCLHNLFVMAAVAFSLSTPNQAAAQNGNAPSARTYHTAVWTGNDMVVWGGFNGASFVGSGGRFDPAANFWTTNTLVGAPSARIYHSAIWDGSEMIVWGGDTSSGYRNTGGRYDPVADSWVATETINAPVARIY